MRVEPIEFRDRPDGIDAEWLWERCIPEPNMGCWLWLGYCDTSGYGVITRRCSATGRTIFSPHRVAFRLAHGPVPTGHVVMHRCDVRCCINPAHLTHGTPADNSADRDRKGRYRLVEPKHRARGERVGLAKLNAEIVIEARRRAANGESYQRLASEFGVSDVAMGLAVKRRTWRHVP